jgi:hypothetical protein
MVDDGSAFLAVVRAIARELTGIGLKSGGGFDKGQLRDSRGRWSSTSGTSSPKYQIGITSHRRAPEPGFKPEHLQEFRDAMKQTPVKKLRVNLGRGGWKDEAGVGREPSFITQYKGNGEGIKALARFGKKYNQDGVLVQRYCGKDEPGAQPQVRIAFSSKVTPQERSRIENLMLGIKTGDKGIEGWSWTKHGGKRVLMLTCVPPWGGEASAHMANCAKLKSALMQSGHRVSSRTRSVAVTAIGRDDYDDFISGSKTAN